MLGFSYSSYESFLTKISDDLNLDKCSYPIFPSIKNITEKLNITKPSFNRIEDFNISKKFIGIKTVSLFFNQTNLCLNKIDPTLKTSLKPDIGTFKPTIVNSSNKAYIFTSLIVVIYFSLHFLFIFY
ncbi:MAG: hypothetical protein GY830_00830 [Bacteroidetes bacterium]|nr:hypothetical protein [Bacteroidota bacterium]